MGFKSYSTKQQKGFSVIEALIAAIIVAVGVIPVFDMISQANKSMSSIEEETIAFGLASESAEWLRAQPFNSLQYPDTYIKFFPQDCLIEMEAGYHECVEAPVQTFESTKSKSEKIKIAYQPAKQFSIYTRKSRIYKPQDNAIKVEVIVNWNSRLDPSKSREKSEVKLQFMSFPVL
tara:strand:- start:2993 stop:3520 length:528 start_codon:yes stop_codon:yes gene_type:complete